MSGIYNILTPASGAFMGINDATYSLWAPATAYPAGNAPLTFNKIMLAISGAVNKGLGDDINEIDVIVSPGAWQNLGNDLAALSTIDSSWKSADAGNGSEAISFFCQAGKVKVITHRLMKEGFAFIHPKASRFFERVGCQSTPTFKLPGMVSAGDEQYLLTMQNNAGIELRNYWNTSVFTDKRCQGRIISGIVNATV
jgi:hypothetical protein